MRHLAGTGFIGQCLARHHGGGEHEAAGDAEPLQDAAARDLLDPDVLLETAKLAVLAASVVAGVVGLLGGLLALPKEPRAGAATTATEAESQTDQ